MRKFDYLEYIYRISYNGRQERYIRERVRKGAALLGEVWGIEKRRFKREWGEREGGEG